MLIKYDPVFAFDIIHLHCTAYEKQMPGISEWTPGQVKEIPDDLQVRVRVRGQVYYAKLKDILLTSADFKTVTEERTFNPNFICSRCGIETRETAIAKPHILPTFRSKSIRGTPLEIDGELVCKACWTRAPKVLTETGYQFFPEDK